MEVEAIQKLPLSIPWLKLISFLNKSHKVACAPLFGVIVSIAAHTNISGQHLKCKILHPWVNASAALTRRI